MDFGKTLPWVAPALTTAMKGSYIYPSSYPNLSSSAANSREPGTEDLSLKPVGYTLRGYTRESRGHLAAAPFVRPSRQFLLYVPASYREYKAMPLLVWLHGCSQSVEEFRDGTRIIQWADQRGFLVLMPRQSRWANPLGCWNWFDAATQNGVGETAVVLAQARFVRSRWNIDPQRIWIAGMSSGAALAACIAVHGYKEISAAAFVSGLADGAAISAGTAKKVMAGITDVDVTEIAYRASRRSSPRPLRSLIIHGDADQVAAPAHADELARQMLALNGEYPVATPLRTPDLHTETLAAGRRLRRDQYKILGQTVVNILRIEGLGHAWSGGDANFSFNDASPPDTTQLILDFFADQ